MGYYVGRKEGIICFCRQAYFCNVHLDSHCVCTIYYICVHVLSSIPQKLPALWHELHANTTVTNLGAVHEVAEIFHQYLLEHVQVSDQDLRHLPNVEPIALHKRSTSNTRPISSVNSPIYISLA